MLDNINGPSRVLRGKVPNLLQIQAPNLYEPTQTLQGKSEMTLDDLGQMVNNAPKNPRFVSGETPFASDVAGDLTGRYESVVYGANNENAYAQQQSGVEQAVRGTLKGANLVLTTMAGGAGMVYGGIKAVLPGGKFSDLWKNPIMDNLEKWNESVDQKYLPNYYTDIEQNAAWYSPDNWKTPNFLFDKLVKNSGYAVGAMYSGNIMNGLLKAGGSVLGGIAAEGAIAAEAASLAAESATAAKTFKTFTPILKNLSRAFSAAKNIEADQILKAGLNSIGDIEVASSELANISRTTNKLANIGDEVRRTVIAGYSSAGEASFETLQTTNQHRNNLIQQYRDTHYGADPTGDDLEAIEENTRSLGAASFIGNMAILGVTEYFQLNKLLGSSYSAEKQAANSLIGEVNQVVSKGGKYIAKVPTTKFGRILDRTIGVGKYVFDPKEAAQENLQYALQIGTQHYFNKAYQGKEAQTLVDTVLAAGESAVYGLVGENSRGEGVGSFNSKEGIEGSILGGITGGGMQAIANWGQAARKASNTEKFLQNLNTAPTFKKAFVDRMGSVNRGVKLQEEEQAAIVAGDVLEAKDRKADQMHNYLSTRIKYGRYDMVKEDIKDLRKMSSTEKGLGQLKEEGVANINDDIASFQKRLATFEQTAKDTNEIYKSLDLTYSGKLNKKGELMYTPETIDKLAYAASKINNYDLRIPAVNQGLTLNNIPTFDLLGKIMDGTITTAEAKKQGYGEIDKLDIAPEKKTTLKLELDDMLEMSLRRKLYMNEYESIVKTPEKWTTKDEATSAREVTDEETEEDVVPAPPAAAQQGEATPVAPLPIAAESTLSTAPVEEVIPQPVIPERKVATFVNKNGVEESFEEGREYANKGYNENDPLHKFKVVQVNDDGTMNIELSDGSVVKFNPELFSGAERVRDGRDVIISNAQQIKDIQDEIEEKSDFSTGFEVDEYVGDKEPGLPSAEKLFFRTKTASSSDPRYTAGLPINIVRYNEFTNNLDGLPNRKNIRFVYVTPNQQDALGLSRLAELSYMKDGSFETTTDWLESITGVEKGLVMAVFVEQEGGKLFLIDKDGKRIKNQDGSDAVLGNPNNNFDIKQTIFSTTPTTDGEGRSSDDPEVIKHYRELWKDKRAELFKAEYQPGQSIDSYEFDLSKGFAVREKGNVQHNPISEVFGKIKQSVISGVQGLIEVSTLGYIVHKNGMSYKFAVGRPVLKYGDKLEYLQNDKITPNQAVTFVEVLKKLHNVFADTSMSTDQKKKENAKLLNYIKAVLFWSSKKVTNNSFYINYATAEINIAGTNFDFSDVEGQKKEIIEKLSNVYTNTSNELLTKYFNESFYEQFWDGKELKERKWKNYQTYLLSDVMPDNKTKRTTAPPLTVNITVPTESVPYVYEQKYAFPTNLQLANPQVTKYDLTGKKVNTMNVFGIDFKFTYGPEGLKFTADANMQTAVEERVQRAMAGDPELAKQDPEKLLSDMLRAVAEEIKKELGATNPVNTAPTKYATNGTDPNKIELQGVVFTFTHDGTKATLDLSPEFLNGELAEGVLKLLQKPEFAKADPDELRLSLARTAEKLANNAVANQLANEVKAAVVPEVPTTSAVGQLESLNEVLDNYGLTDEFKFITPILIDNNIQVSYDAAHRGGKLPGVASIDSELVDGKYEVILTINRAAFDKKTKAEQKYVIAHEFTHGLIKIRLNEKGDVKGTELYKGLTDIYQSVEDYFHKGVSGVDKKAAKLIADNFSKPQITYLRQALDYIAKSPEEMATMGLTDPDMIKFLKLMPGTTPAYAKKNLFTQLVELISKVVGLSNSKFNDLLTFMSEQLEEATGAPNTGVGVAQEFLNQQITPKQRKKRNGYPVFPELSAEQKYYLTEDFKAAFYLSLFKDTASLFNFDKTSANAIFKNIVDTYKNKGAQYTDEQYMEIIDATKRQLNGLYISFDAEEIVTINDEGASDKLYAPEAFSVNLKKSTPYAVKILNSSLLRTDGKQSEDPTMLPNPKINEAYDTVELIPESEVYSVLVNRLVNIKNVDDFVNKLYDIAKSNADYVQLFVKLGGNMVTGKIDFDNFEDAEHRLFISAMQTYTKAKPEMFIQYLKEDSTFRGAADLSTGAKQVEKRWINNMIIASKIESSIIKYNREQKQYEVDGDNIPENSIDFLNKIGITFTPSIYDKLSDVQKKEFEKAVIKMKADITSGKKKGVVSLKKGKFKTLGNGIARLADLFTAVEMPNQNNSIYNAEGKRINTLTESNYPSVFEYQFNSIMNLSEIKDKMPHLLDVFSASSDILKQGGLFFNEDGERIVDEDGNITELRVQVISGEIDTDENEGSGISGMSEADSYITQINQNIKGSYYILIPADSSTEWMMNLGNRISYKQFAEGRGSEEAIAMMRKHLDADIELALDAKNRKKLLNVEKKATELRFFKDILPESLNNEITSLIEQRVSGDLKEKKFRNELQEVLSTNDAKITESITKYLSDSAEDVTNKLKDLKLVTTSPQSKEGEVFYSFKKLDALFQDDIKAISGINANKMTEGDLNLISEFLSSNYILNNIEFHKIIFGDPYQFGVKEKNGKVILEETKRIKMFLSPRKFAIDYPALNSWLNESNNAIELEDDNYIDLDDTDYGYHESKSYINTAVIEEVIIEGGLYPGVDTKEADGFSYMDAGFYREVKTKNGQWSDQANDFHNWQMAYARKKLAARQVNGEPVYKGYKDKPALKKYDEELTSKPSPKFVIDVTKPIVAGVKLNATNIDLIGHKMSQMPLYFEAIEGTALEDVFIKMFNEKLDYVVMQSGAKFGIESMYELYKDGKINDEPMNNLIQIPFTAYGIQVETGYKDKKGQTLGSQPTKIATIDLFSGGEAIGDTPERQQVIKEAVERHDNALKRLYTEGADSLLNELGITIEDGEFVLANKEKVASVLRKQLLDDGASNNLIESLQINPETGDFNTPLESSPNYMQIVRLLYSIIHKRIISPKVNGMSAVQTPVTGWEDLSKGRRVVEINGKKVLTDDTLKFYEDEEGLRYCQVFVTLTPQARALFSDKKRFSDEDAIVKYLNTASPDALMAIGFRIPTQGLNSMERIKIKGILAEFMGTTVVVPSEITTKAGSDFDIDKLNLYMKALYKDSKGNIKVIEYKGSEEATKQFYSQVFDELSDKEQRFLSKKFEEVDLEDVDARQKLTTRQEELNDKIINKQNTVDKMYRQAIENEYYSAIDDLLALPENFERLTTPNTTDTLMGIANKMDELTNYDESKIKNRILDRQYMSFLRYAFQKGKSWIGISATATTGLSLAQKSGLFVDHVFKMSLPHNKTADGKVDLSQRFFAGTKNYISDILSEFTSAFADAGSDPFIFKLIYSNAVVSPAMFLTRAGVNIKQAMFFLNQPIVKDFVTTADADGKYILTEMTAEKSTLIDSIKSKYAASKDAVERTEEIDVNNLDKNIGVEKLTEDQKAEQLLILQEFFSVAKAANGLFIITEATNYDTFKSSNADDFRRKQIKTLTQYKFAQDSFRISSAKDLLDKTHLRSLVDGLTKANRGLGKILRFNTPDYRAVINQVIDTYAMNDFISPIDFSKIANKLSGSLLDYIIQTNINFDIPNLVYGEDSVINKFQKAVEAYPNMKILQDLEVIPGKTINAPSTIALKVAADSSADVDRYTEAFRELRDNPETNDLYKSLLNLAIVQGTYKTAVSFKEVMPQEDVSAEITKAINTPGVENRLKDFYENVRFQRTNFNDPNIAPRINPPMRSVPEADIYLPFGDIIEAYAFPSAITFNGANKESSRDLIGLGLKSKGAGYDFVTITRGTYTKEGELVDFESGYTVQPSDLAIQLQKDENIYNKVYGYQKVKYRNGMPVKMKMSKTSPEQYVFKLVNLYGDGRFLTQYQNTLQKSELNNGTVKVDKEYSDDAIIKALDNQGKLVGYSETSIAPVAAQPVAETSPVEQKPANIEILEKLEMAKNKLEAFEFSTDGIFYNYFKSGARIKPGSFDKLVDRNRRSASTNGAYTSTKGAYSYDSLASQAFQASSMEVDDTFAVEALEEFLSNYPDTWKTPYENIMNEIKDLENQLNPAKKSTEKVVSSQLSLFDENQPEGLPAINRSPKTC
jgi:6-pyruvoyl-tetrahydropterin synthase